MNGNFAPSGRESSQAVFTPGQVVRVLRKDTDIFEDGWIVLFVHPETVTVYKTVDEETGEALSKKITPFELQSWQ